MKSKLNDYIIIELLFNNKLNNLKKNKKVYIFSFFI